FPLPNFEVQAPMLSLPGIFRTELATIPGTVPYLFADEKLVDDWQQKLAASMGERTGIKIGIAWQGSPTHRGDRYRSLPLTQFEPIACVEGVQLFSLQKGKGLEQLPALADRFPVVDVGSQLDEVAGGFMATAAVMKNLDLVICCDTSIAHLAGALAV